MFINELPDDCFFTIFGFIYELDDLLNCYKVCNKWSQLITERTKRVAYLMSKYPKETDHLFSFKPMAPYPHDCVYWRTKEPIDGSFLRKLFPNLIVITLSGSFLEKVKFEDGLKLIETTESLKGLISFYCGSVRRLSHCLPNLEMVSCDYYDECIWEKGSNFKQLKAVSYCGPFKEFGYDFPNLERLNILCFLDVFHDSSMLVNLKVLEISLELRFASLYELIDKCPNLQSVYIRVVCPASFRVYGSLIYEYLQDFVIEFEDMDPDDWDHLKRLLMRCPNLKHLALRKNMELQDEHIEQLVDVLPNLVLLDVRGCPNVTRYAVHQLLYTCQRNGRSIKIYLKERNEQILADWPNLSFRIEIVSRGFDFMKHCFLKDFYELPHFLIHDENRY